MSKIKWEMGEVIWFDEFAGEGAIRGIDGSDYIVHYSAIDSKDKWKTLKANSKVKFEVSEDPFLKQVSKIKEI